MSLPEGWRETTLGEVAKFRQGYQSPVKEQVLEKKEGYIRFIRIVDFTKNDSSDFRYIKNPGSKYIVDTDDLIMIRYGSQTAGKIARGFSGVIANNTFKVSPSEDILNKEFLFLFLSQNTIYNYFHSTQSSSTMPAITFELIGSLDILIPPLQEQKSIANILSSFDEKIELLKEQNETLEQMAQGVFKESLNKFENSNKTTLGELVKIKYGKDHKHLEDGGFPLYGSGGVMRYVEKTLYDKESILIPRKGTLSNLFFIQEPFWSVDTIFYTEIDESLVSPIYLFYKLKRINLANLNVGSAVPSLTTNVLNALELEVPPREEQEETVQLLTSFNNKVLYNKSQIKTLEKTRDTLLPKLMSGEIRVQGYGI